MPTYQYTCQECGKSFERVEPMAQHGRGRAVTCPKCQGKKVEPVLAAPFVKTSKKS